MWSGKCRFSLREKIKPEQIRKKRAVRQDRGYLPVPVWTPRSACIFALVHGKEIICRIKDAVEEVDELFDDIKRGGDTDIA